MLTPAISPVTGSVFLPVPWSRQACPAYLAPGRNWPSYDHHVHHHHHPSLNFEACWGTTDDFTTSFLSVCVCVCVCVWIYLHWMVIFLVCMIRMIILHFLQHNSCYSCRIKFFRRLINNPSSCWIKLFIRLINKTKRFRFLLHALIWTTQITGFKTNCLPCVLHSFCQKVMLMVQATWS